MQNGFSVAFMSADHLVDVVRRDEAADGPQLHRRKYMATSLLIIDELGFQALDRREAHLLVKARACTDSVSRSLRRIPAPPGGESG